MDTQSFEYFCLLSRDLKGTLSERMIRRYASVPEEDKEAATTNFRSNIFARKQSHSGGDKSKHFKQLSKGLSKEEIETNKKRIASVADLMTVFADENDLSSDQDELIEELQNIGYIITSKGSGNK